MGTAAGGAAAKPEVEPKKEVDLAKLFRDRLREQLAKGKSILGTTEGKAAAAAVLMKEVPVSIERIRAAPRRHRGWMVFRELLRSTGRVLLPAAWPAVEMIGAGARRAVHNAKRKR